MTIAVTAADGSSGAAIVTLVTTGITISPTTASLTTNQTQQFTATVSGSTNTGVTWSINPQIGAIDQTGFYTAPSVVSGTTKVTVTATSQADTTKSASAGVTIATTIDVGSGAPTPALTQAFFSAFYRNGFNNLAGLPPIGIVKALGTTAGFYVQEFPDAAKTSGVRYALASASSTVAGPSADGTPAVLQIYAPVYAYYLTVGASTAGYPLSDTLNCPSFDPANSCQFQQFDKSYALFVYDSALPSTGGTTFAVRAGIYTEWLSLGGVTGIGRPINAETSITATKIAPNTAGTTATAQQFSGGVIYSITSNSQRGQVHGVTEPIYDLYVAAGGPTGSLGLPTSEVLVNTVTGLHKQTFEGGVLQYTPNGGPTQQLPVVAVNLTGAAPGTTVTLSLGQSLTLSASPVDSLGDILTDRPISWSSTNGQVVSIQAQPATQSAVITAIAGGTATVTASSGGVASGKVTIVVTSPCCQVGDGAPASVQSAFQNALARNKVSVQIPVAAPAIRQGAGYVQTVQSTGSTASMYLLAQSDQVATAFLITGAILTQYQFVGGPSGLLGYPISDASAGGTQRFENGALAGSPVRMVTGPILAKWALLGYETGAAGAPSGDAKGFSTFGANSGVVQAFVNGTIYAATAGPRSGQANFVTGPILTAYQGAGDVSGDMGMPVGDEFIAAGVHKQAFEGGTISYDPGVGTAQIQAAPKTPSVIVAPASISAGARARLAVTGFANGAIVRVSISGQPDFLVTSANGAYAWEMFIPLTAASGVVTIRAVDVGSGASASGILTLKGFDSNRVQITIVRGDKQTGVPGALLPVPLQVALKDAAGTPIVGAAVTFQASTGAQVSAASAVTDDNGQASTYLRLPNVAGVSGVVAASAVAQSAVSFYSVAGGSAIANFPSVVETGSTVLGAGPGTIGQKGALLFAVAGILRYQQNRGAVGSPNGLVDAAALNQYLTTYCGADQNANRVCDGFLSNPDSGEQIVNLWRAARFTGGIDVTPVAPTLPAIADLVSQGEPVLLSLGLSVNGGVAGGHVVVATGVADDGSILIQDPNPAFARSNLSEYLNGFQAVGSTWRGSVLGAVRFAVRSPAGTRFLLAALSQPASLMNGLAFDISSPAGPCGMALQMLDTVDALGNTPPRGALVSRMQVCDGSQSAYQVSLGAAQPYRAFATDLASGGGIIELSGTTATTYRAYRPLLNLSITPLVTGFAANAVVNAATFTPAIAPGGIVSIFGTGLAGGPGGTTVDFDGSVATVLSASPFQVNAVMPGDVTPGVHTVRVKSAYGSAQQSVNVSDVAPAIFLVGNPATGAVENQDGSLNGAVNPGMRGQILVIYVTGLGAVTKHGNFFETNSTVTAIVNGAELPVAFAGLAPGFAGLYQVNVPIPTTMPPGLGISLTLKQGGQLSNAVNVAIQ